MEGLCSSEGARSLFVALLPEVDDAAFVEDGVISPVMRRRGFVLVAWRLTPTAWALHLWSCACV